MSLQTSHKYTYSKMSNQETEDVLSFQLGILNCNTKIGNETAGYVQTNFWIAIFGNIFVVINIEMQHKDELTFEL